MTFLTNNYEREQPTSQYLKLAPNTSATIRIISRPVEGYQVFIDGKPIRWNINGEMPKKCYTADEKPKSFAAFMTVLFPTPGTPVTITILILWS